jgi:hypothetical protein
VKEKLIKIFNSIPIGYRHEFLPLAAQLNFAVDTGEIEAAKNCVKCFPVIPELEPMRKQILNILNQ